MTTKFTMLGSGGWIPTARRETTCAMLSFPDALFLFDAGTGISRLLEVRFRGELEGERPVHLFLSHYHLDHIIGLFYLPAMFLGRTVHLHPPEEGITGVDPEAAVRSVIRKPYNPHYLDDMPLDIKIEALGEGENEVAGRRVSARKQIHTDPSMGIRVDDLLVFATDTARDPGTVPFAEGVSLLVHEAWIDGAEEDDPETKRIAEEAYVSHTSARQAAELATEAGVENLALSHLSPVRGDNYHAGMLQSARKIFPETMILEDGQGLDL